MINVIMNIYGFCLLMAAGMSVIIMLMLVLVVLGNLSDVALQTLGLLK
jgi:hypothetical protein